MAKYIKGQDRNQLVLFADKLDDLVGENEEVRVIDKFVDAIDIVEKGFKRAMVNTTGTNTYDPRDLLKLYLYGYRHKVRSSRKLEELCKKNIEVMWLLGGLKPDFRTISDFRKENAKELKEVFKETVRISAELKLLGEKESQDGYKVAAVNSKENNYTLSKIDERIERIEKQIEKYMKEMDEIDKKESAEERIEITEEMVEELKRRKEEKEKGIEEKKNKKEELEKIRKEMEEEEETQKSLIDKDARLMKNKGDYIVGYNVQEMTDTKSHIVTNYEATNNPGDIGSMKKIAEEAKEIMGKEIIDNITDQGYKDRKDMAECLKKGIRPQVTLGEEENYEIEFEYKEKEISEEKKKSRKEEDIKECLEAGVIPEVYEDILSELKVIEKKEVTEIEEIEAEEEIDKEDLRRIAMEKEVFIKDREHNKVYCPQGEVLRQKSKHGEKTKYCNKLACKRCKKPCTMSKFKEVMMGERQVVSGRGENGKELSKKYNPQEKKKREKVKVVKVKLTPKEEDMKIRMQTSEHAHGTLKRTDDASYLLLKGLDKVNGELALSYCATNIRRIINIVGINKIIEHLEKRKEAII